MEKGDTDVAAPPGPVIREAMSHIFALVGFMGSGKTSVGAAAAGLLGVPFLDLDGRIEAAAGATVAELFARRGEAGFRDQERESLRAALADLDAGGILATGGGTFVDPENRRLLARPGVVTVWLDVALEDIERRVPRDGSRPLFGDPAALRKLFDARQEHYRAADLRVEVGRADTAEAALRLVRTLRAGPLSEAGQ